MALFTNSWVRIESVQTAGGDYLDLSVIRSQSADSRPNWISDYQVSGEVAGQKFSQIYSGQHSWRSEPDKARLAAYEAFYQVKDGLDNPFK